LAVVVVVLDGKVEVVLVVLDGKVEVVLFEVEL
jgi:hypothetical protein